MNRLVAVAAGGDAADILETRYRTGEPRDQRSFVRHRDVAVAWAESDPWTHSCDDGLILVVMDGRLHNAGSDGSDPARFLLERYRERTLDVARDLLGDFVLVILDRGAHRLLVARDPVGVRPWYQATSGPRWAGATDIVSLVDLPWVDTNLNEGVALEYLAAVPESRGETFYCGIRTLPPGHTWQRTADGVKSFAHHLWDLRPDLDISWEEAAQRCRDVLAEAVRCRLPAGRPATSELSGGLDSSSVVGTIAMLGEADLVVGRMTFDGPRADERVYSDAVIEHWGLRAVSVAPWMPTSEEIGELSSQLRRPAPDPNFTMFVSLHRALRAEGRIDGCTGLGGDDAFQAYGIAPRVISAVKLRQGQVLKQVGSWVGRNPKRVWPELVKPMRGYAIGPYRTGGHPPWVSSVAARRSERLWHFGQRARRVTGIDAIDERLGSFTSGYNAAILEDRAAIGDWAGRRDSHPFLDPRFVGATYALDPWWPTRNGHTRALQVEAFRDRLPPVVAGRASKAEFSEVFWPRLLAEVSLERVRAGPLRRLGWLDPKGFDALVVNAKRGMANAAIPLYRCTSLDAWLRAQEAPST